MMMKTTFHEIVIFVVHKYFEGKWSVLSLSNFSAVPIGTCRCCDSSWIKTRTAPFGLEWFFGLFLHGGRRF